MSIHDILILALIGLSAGIISGALGIGGAIIIVPALVFFFGMSQHNAQGTSLGVLVFPVGLLAVINYYKAGFINFRYSFIIIMAFFIGGYLGSLFSINMPEKILKTVFGVFLLIISVRMIFGK